MAHFLSAKEFSLLCNKGRRIKDGHYTACCPAHDDSSPSMNIQDTEDKLLVHCYAGCTVEEICESLNIKMTDLFASDKEFTPTRYKESEEEFDRAMVMIFEEHRKNGSSFSESDEETYIKSKLRLAQHGVLKNGRGWDQI